MPTELLVKSKEIIIEETKPLIFQRARLIRDFIRLGKSPLIDPLDKEIEKESNRTVEIYRLRGIVSVSSTYQLLNSLPIEHNYSNAIVANRIISEGLSNEFLSNIKFENLNFATKAEITKILSRKEDKVELVIKLYKIYQHDNAYTNAESTATSRMANRLIREEKMDFEIAIKMLNETNLLNDPSLGIIASGFAQIGNI